MPSSSLKINYPTGRKLCSHSLHVGPRWLVIMEFNVAKRDRWGEPQYLRSECRTCARMNDRVRLGLLRHGEPMRSMEDRRVRRDRPLTPTEIQSRYMQRHRAVFLAKRREHETAKRRARGIPPRFERPKPNRVLLAAADFLEYITPARYSQLSHHHKRRVRCARQTGLIELGAADRILVALGEHYMLSVLWPGP